MTEEPWARAYSAIAKEYERHRAWQGAMRRNRAAVQEQKRESYLEACWACQLAIDKHELFVFLYGHMAYSLPFWRAAWQASKNLVKAKSKRRRQAAQKRFQWLIGLIQQDCRQNGMSFEQARQLAFGLLDAIVQSSALVEAVNSIIRPYVCLTRRQTSQSLLQLVMFFHNHRKFERGKRKGKAPIEMLTGQKLEKGPIELLLLAAGL